MQFAEAASILAGQGQLEDKVHMFLCGPGQQRNAIRNIASLVLSDVTEVPVRKGTVASIISRISIRDKRVPNWIYDACGIETRYILYGSDTMSYYPVRDNDYSALRVTQRYHCPLPGTETHFSATGELCAYDRDVLRGIVRIIATAMGTKKITVPTSPYVFVSLQYPEYFLRERGMTPKILIRHFNETIQSCLDKGYHVYVKPHYRLMEGSQKILRHPQVMSLKRFLHWPLEFFLDFFERPPTAVVGHWSTSLWTVPFLREDIPAFHDQLSTYFRYLEDWQDPHGTKNALLLHALNSPPLEALPFAAEHHRAPDAFSDHFEASQRGERTDLARIVHHLKFDVPDPTVFEELRACVRDTTFPAGLFNIAERRRLKLWEQDAYTAFVSTQA
ncbi:MAG: hypothetical protein AAFU63_00180 [Pseudomonadota bacterium]